MVELSENLAMISEIGGSIRWSRFGNPVEGSFRSVDKITGHKPIKIRYLCKIFYSFSGLPRFSKMYNRGNGWKNTHFQKVIDY